MNTKRGRTIEGLKKLVRKRETTEDTAIHERNQDAEESVGTKRTREVNTIMKGSTLVGDINIAHDLELSGDVEGNITSEHTSNIVIKGNCKGNITTREGNVQIEGQILNGDIFAGGYVRVTGRFNGGKIEAKEKIYIDGEFRGTLQSNEIEVGPSARGKGDLMYYEYISIHKGAQVDAQIRRIPEERREVRKSAQKKVIDLEVPVQQKSEVQ